MKRLASTVTAAMALATSVLAGDAAFQTWRGDTSLSGVVNDSVPDRPTQLWKFLAGAPVSFAPVAGDGNVFVVTGKSKVFALDMKGNKVWAKTLEVKPIDTNTPVQTVSISAPPAYAFGTLVLASSDGGVYALDGKNGNEKWTGSVGSAVQGTPNFADMGKDGWLVVVLSQSDGVLTAFDGVTGKEKWHTESYGRTDGHIAISGGRIAFGGCDATIHVLSTAGGNEKTAVPLGEGSEVAGGVAIVGKMVYSGSRGGALQAVDTEKNDLKWSFGGGAGELFSTPAANANVVVFSAGNGSVSAVDAGDPKSEKWSFDGGGMAAQSPLIVGDRVVVVVDGKVHILDIKDGKKPLWTSPSVGDSATPPAVVGGMIIVGSDAGSVVAFGAKPGDVK